MNLADSPPSVLQPQGPAAAHIADLSMLLFVAGGAVFVLVMLLLAIALLRRPRRTGAEAGAQAEEFTPVPLEALAAPGGGRMILLGGVIMPVLVLSGVLALTVNTLLALAAPAQSDETVVEVIGHQFWWEVRYPDHDVVTANELHLPVGRPVRVRLTAQDVIHSFWVPELHGKLDMIPNQTNSFWLQADKAGIYKGLCAEFCGVQHAKMTFLAVAQPAAEFDAWLAAQQTPARVPAEPLAQRGAQVFLTAGCANCHAIRGTDATGNLGPDLTHLAARRTLAAGILPNEQATLARWIVDPQHSKPGNLMPPTLLADDDLQALVAYLETLN